MIAIQKAVSSKSVDVALSGIVTKLAIHYFAIWEPLCPSGEMLLSILWLENISAIPYEFNVLTNIARRILDLLCAKIYRKIRRCLLAIHLQYQPIAETYLLSAHWIDHAWGGKIINDIGFKNALTPIHDKSNNWKLVSHQRIVDELKNLHIEL